MNPLSIHCNFPLPSKTLEIPRTLTQINSTAREEEQRRLHRMEEETAALKRRSSVPSSMVIPANFEAIPMIKPRPSPSATANGHIYRRLPPTSSSSSSPSSSSSVSATIGFDLVSFKPSPTYTSLKDLLLPSSPSLLSPTPVSAGASSATAATFASSGGASTLEISIRNRLVKQAAWAYLQPMASSPSASGRRLLSYFSGDFINPFLSSIKCVFVDWAARTCNWLADALWLLLCR